MVEKIFDNISHIDEMNQTAEKLRQLGMREELEKLALKYGVSQHDAEDFFAGEKHALIDNPSRQNSYNTVRSKILDEMSLSQDPYFENAVGQYLLKQCSQAVIAKQILKPHKTLEGCVNYLMTQAWNLIDDERKEKQLPMGLAVPEDAVYKWIDAYYAADDAPQYAEEQKRAEEAFQEMVKKADIGKRQTAVKAKKAKDKPRTKKKLVSREAELEQLSLFAGHDPKRE